MIQIFKKMHLQIYVTGYFTEQYLDMCLENEWKIL